MDDGTASAPVTDPTPMAGAGVGPARGRVALTRSAGNYPGAATPPVVGAGGGAIAALPEMTTIIDTPGIAAVGYDERGQRLFVRFDTGSLRAFGAITRAQADMIVAEQTRLRRHEGRRPRRRR